MSLDLTLLPFDYEDNNFAYSHTMLPCVANCYNLFDDLKKESEEQIPNSIRFMDELSLKEISNGKWGNLGCFLERTEDGGYKYGDAKNLHYLTVEALLKYKNHPLVQKWSKHRAAWAYLESLDPKIKVALFWS